MTQPPSNASLLSPELEPEELEPEELEPPEDDELPPTELELLEPPASAGPPSAVQSPAPPGQRK
jgi:hypothetical protein